HKPLVRINQLSIAFVGDKPADAAETGNGEEVALTVADLPLQLMEPRRRTLLFDHGLLLCQHQVHRPAASDVFARVTAVIEHVGTGAARVFEGIGENRQAVEGALIVDALREGDDVPGPPGGIDPDGTESVAEDVTENAALDSTFLVGGVGAKCVETAEQRVFFLFWQIL